MDEPRFRAHPPLRRECDGVTYYYEFQVVGPCDDYVRLTPPQNEAVLAWCRDNCVDWPDRDRRYPRWSYNHIMWILTDSRDALAFKMRWC